MKIFPSEAVIDFQICFFRLLVADLEGGSQFCLRRSLKAMAAGTLHQMLDYEENVNKEVLVD